MIYILDKTDEKTVLIPKNKKSCKLDYKFLLKSELDNKFYGFDVTDENYLSNYYSFSIDFSDIPNGEYTYQIDDEEKGLLRIGEIEYDHTDYENNENNDYIVYGD